MGLTDKIKQMAMRLREKIKLAHEKNVADELLSRLGIKPGGAPAHGNPDKNEPDRLYKIDDKIVGVEVTTAYYSEVEAKTAHEVAEKPLAKNDAKLGEVMGSPDDSICESIQENLDQKCGKKYSNTNETWLCISIEAGITDTASIEECIAGLKVPKSHPFTRIFVTVRKSENEGGGLEVIRIA